MKLRSPAEFYIKYLVVHPNRYDNAAIKATLEDMNIICLEDSYVDAVRARCVAPDPFHPNEKHAKSDQFLMREGILSLFERTAATRLAFRIIEMPRIKEFVETMILSHAPALAISTRVSQQGLSCTPEAIEEFKKFFWNIELLSSTQMRMLLHLEMDKNVEENDKADVRNEKRALKKASYLDPRKVAADLPYSPLTSLMAQMRMGLMPNRLELARVLQAAQSMAAVKTLEACMYGSPQDAGKAMSFAIVVKSMTEALETVVKPDDELHDRLQAIALRAEPSIVPSIHQLSAGGQHTVEVQPTQQMKALHESIAADEGRSEGSD